jgi:hydroxymethylpyrimidine/phosphomethylpyrimidine kinase
LRRWRHLSAALCALLASGNDLQAACAEALTYLDQCLDAGFQPGMGHAVPDRLFWAHDGDETTTPTTPIERPVPSLGDFPPTGHTH